MTKTSGSTGEEFPALGGPEIRKEITLRRGQALCACPEDYRPCSGNQVGAWQTSRSRLLTVRLPQCCWHDDGGETDGDKVAATDIGAESLCIPHCVQQQTIPLDLWPFAKAPCRTSSSQTFGDVSNTNTDSRLAIFPQNLCSESTSVDVACPDLVINFPVQGLQSEQQKARTCRPDMQIVPSLICIRCDRNRWFSLNLKDGQPGCSRRLLLVPGPPESQNPGYLYLELGVGDTMKHTQSVGPTWDRTRDLSHGWPMTLLPTTVGVY
ncbi:hypothetical protein PoB_006635900 [Plakobranchus ocellatus]|uniref:Uncharacterized protein n=1 Tax=Plakobranchus ocellatus TaxID=259542 RepID=A0AAV4D6T8_9GAST|nr:hypothetical protein PoB_006635900 [Plakobranchus ocellatus]